MVQENEVCQVEIQLEDSELDLLAVTLLLQVLSSVSSRFEPPELDSESEPDILLATYTLLACMRMHTLIITHHM